MAREGDRDVTRADVDRLSRAWRHALEVHGSGHPETQAAFAEFNRAVKAVAASKPMKQPRVAANPVPKGKRPPVRKNVPTLTRQELAMIQAARRQEVAARLARLQQYLGQRDLDAASHARGTGTAGENRWRDEVG